MHTASLLGVSVSGAYVAKQRQEFAAVRTNDARWHKDESLAPNLEQATLGKSAAHAATLLGICQESLFDVPEETSRNSGNHPILTQIQDNLTVRIG